MTREIQISVGDPVSTAKDFIEVWNRLESGKRDDREVRRDFMRLEQIGLIRYTTDGLAEVGWDIVETRLRLAA